MSGKASKFGFLKGALQNPEAEPREDTPVDESLPAVEEASPSPAPSMAQAAEPAPKLKAKARSQAPEPSGPVGRPRGKRSDGDHVQVTAYIRRATHFGVKTALLREQNGQDFSGLVEELLAKWLKSRT